MFVHKPKEICELTFKHDITFLLDKFWRVTSIQYFYHFRNKSRKEIVLSEEVTSTKKYHKKLFKKKSELVELVNQPDLSVQTLTDSQGQPELETWLVYWLNRPIQSDSLNLGLNIKKKWA